MKMYISSGQIGNLLMGKHTQGHRELINTFINDDRPRYNAKRSPIDALRTGAILEDRFYLILDDNYIPQCEVWNTEYAFCRSTLDFAIKENNQVKWFKELKTCFYTDFLKFQEYKNTPYKEYIAYIKKYYKDNYNQTQFHLFNTGLKECDLTFLEVKNYNDNENYTRNIQEDEYIDFKIKRDEDVINQIKNRLEFFKSIIEYFNK